MSDKRSQCELHLDFPFAGSRMLQGLLAGEGRKVGRLHVPTLMKRMDIKAIYRRPNTSKPEPGHKIFPYLLRKLPVTRSNQVWAMDITCIPMARGFVYLAAVIDWFSRKVLSWRLSITMDKAFCIEAVEEALARYGKPEIFNTDQGSQFTCSDFTGLMLSRQIKVSMDGKGAWRDKIFVERLWRSLKYEEVYLHAYDSVAEGRSSIGRYLSFYNSRRPHQSLDRRTPDEAYFNPPTPSWRRHNRGGNPLNDSQSAVQTNRASAHPPSARRQRTRADQPAGRVRAGRGRSSSINGHQRACSDA